MRADCSELMIRVDDMPEGTPHTLKSAIRSTTGARHSKRDFITKLPSSSLEAAGWKKVNIYKQLLQA